MYFGSHMEVVRQRVYNSEASFSTQLYACMAAMESCDLFVNCVYVIGYNTHVLSNRILVLMCAQIYFSLSYLEMP